MIKQKELASLIQKGLEAGNVTESENCFFEDVFGIYNVCALGAALIGKSGCAAKAYEVLKAEKEFALSLGTKI